MFCMCAQCINDQVVPKQAHGAMSSFNQGLAMPVRARAIYVPPIRSLARPVAAVKSLD
jgi:hypothetical protein